MSKFLFPVFLTTPDALEWAKDRDWFKLILVESQRDAAMFIRQLSPKPVPVWKVEMRVTYLTPEAQRADAGIARHIRVHPEIHTLEDAWDKGKWEIGFEAYVGGTRHEDYGVQGVQRIIT